MAEVTIGSLADAGALWFGDGYRTKRSEHGTPGYRILRVADVADGRVDLDGPDFVSDQHERAIGPKLSQAGDVLLTTKGTVGRVAIYPNEAERVVYSPQLCYFRVADRDVIDARFLSYWFKSPAFVRQASHRANNTDMAAYINLRDVASLRVDLPSIRDQRAVAEVLGALDDKIAANERVIDGLTALDSSLFKRLEAMALSTRRLDEIANLAKGYSYRSAELGPSDTALVTLKSIGRDGQFAHRGFKEFVGEPRNAQFVSPGDIVVAQTDLTQAAEVVGRAVRVPAIDAYARLVASLDLIIIRSAGDIPNAYLLGALRSPPFREYCKARTSGTTVLHLGSGAADSYEVPLAPAEEIRQYSEEAEARAGLADATDRENRRLAVTRDELLPLLMSGKVRVKDAEKSVEGVL